MTKQELVKQLAVATKLLQELRAHVDGLPYKDEDFPACVHEGSCGPESGCDAVCMQYANMAETNALLRRVDQFLRP